MAVPIELRTETVIEKVEYAENYLYLETGDYVYIVPASAYVDEDGEIDADAITPQDAYYKAVVVILKTTKEVVRSRYF